MRSTLYLLGTGTPTPTASRFGTCYVLQVGEESLMVDCGPAATFRLVQAGLQPTEVDYLFITHHHFDHNADLPCFLLTRWDQSTGNERELQIWGPWPTRRIVDQLVGPDGVFSGDWQARINAPLSQAVHANRGGSLPRPMPSFEVTDLEPADRIAKDCFTVTTARACHVAPWLRSLAYRVEIGDRSIVFAGDTEPCPPIHDLARGTDVLVVNCWDHQEAMDENGEHLGQTGTLDAANMAAEADAQLLILTHTGPRLCSPGSRERAISDISCVFKGTIVFGEELMELDLW